MKERKLKIAEFVESIEGSELKSVLLTSTGAEASAPSYNTGGCSNGDSGCSGSTNTGNCQNVTGMCGGSHNGASCNNNVKDPGTQIRPNTSQACMNTSVPCK